MSIVEDIREIREIYGEPMERAVKKQLPRLEKHSRAFIALSPFIVMATCDAEGLCDASPTGDAARAMRRRARACVAGAAGSRRRERRA